MLDKKTILAFILIALVLVLTQTRFYKEKFLPKRPVIEEKKRRKVAQPEQMPKETPVATKGRVYERTGVGRTEEPKRSVAGEEFFAVEGKQAEDIVVESDVVKAVLSTEGARIKSWKLKQFQSATGDRVELIDNQGYQNLDLRFVINGDTVALGSKVFEILPGDMGRIRKLSLGKTKNTAEIIFQLTDPTHARQVEKIYTFYNDRYYFDLQIKLKGFSETTASRAYEIVWASGLAPTEDLSMDMRFTKAYSLMGDELVEFNVKKSRAITKPVIGSVQWAAERTKYFAFAMIPKTAKGRKVEFRGRGVEIEPRRIKKEYSMSLEMPLGGERQHVDQFRVYLGPLDYDIVKSLGVKLEKIILSSGWYERLFRPFSIVILKAFKFLHKYIPNYGVVIIIFSVLIKIILYPLTHKSYTSMRKMQAIQPKLAQLREKYKKDPQRLNKETMKLYKQHGVNPMGGCLPMLLQMPILIGLFNVFRSTIQLRGAPFVGWIRDLSKPDTVAHLPFSLPFYGNAVNVLPIVMGLTMLLQQRTTVRDPRQAAMGYIMPVFMVLIFNNFPSGLTLYWSLFNLFSALQQILMKEAGTPGTQPAKK